MKKAIFLLLIFTNLSFTGQLPDNTVIGELSNGGKVIAVQGDNKQWGIRVENPNKSTVEQLAPIQIEYYEAEASIKNLSQGYNTMDKTANGFIGRGKVTASPTLTYNVEDTWSIKANTLSVKRKLTVQGNAYGGFASRISVSTNKNLTYPDVELFSPGFTYGSPDNLYETAPAGLNNYRLGRFNGREEDFPLPLSGIYFGDGSSIAMLDPTPKGNTIMAEQRDRTTTMIDKHYLFGSFGANQNVTGGLNLSYAFPGTLPERKRYHPNTDGFTQEYNITFRFGRDESYHNFYVNSWRWAWKLFNPAINHYDISIVQKSLTDHLAGLTLRVEDRVGIPFWTSMMTGNNFGDAGIRDRDAIMGFVGKDLEGGAMLIRDSYDDKTSKGQNHYKLGIDIINSMVKYVKVSPPTGTGFNIETGEPSMTNPAPNHVSCCNGRLYLREFTDDMRWVLNAYQWEKKHGVEHYNWFRWCSEFGQWLLFQQKPNGSFPRSWYPGTNKVYDDNYQSTYNAMAFLTKLSDVTGGPDFWRAHGSDPFLTAAKKAGDFVWQTYESKDQFVGGTVDNNNIQDKEAGTLSLEGFLALYEKTKEPKWLDRAKAAADYASTWIYGWNIPMADDETDETLHWKRGASIIGASKINSHGSGIDQWMAGDVDEFARLYTYTQDPFYKDIAKMLLHNTKNMVALPGRQYDLYEPGAQQEHWFLSNNRGHGAHRGALPWVTVNHLTGIFALKDFDMGLYNDLSGK